MKQIKLLVAIASLLLVTNASANTIDIEINTNVDKITNKVLNDKIKKMNDDLFAKIELKNDKMMLALQEKMDNEMSFVIENKSEAKEVAEDLYKIHADELKKMRNKYKDKKYLCNKKINTTSI